MLDLWFENEQVGWAAGPFGTLLGTRDGGKTWVSWIEKVDNPKMLHYNAVRGVGGDLYLASEQGMVFKLDRSRERFMPLSTGYKGSFFGVIGTRDYVIAYGLRGNGLPFSRRRSQLAAPHDRRAWRPDRRQPAGRWTPVVRLAGRPADRRAATRATVSSPWP